MKIDTLKGAQGDIATGIGRLFAQQIFSPDTEVSYHKESGAVVYKKTHPKDDKLLVRPTYENNVSVLVDLYGQEFQFKAPLVVQPRAIDIDVAHSILDKMAGDAKKGAVFEKEKAPIDEIAFLIRQQARDDALKRLHDKETLMLQEGFSPEEIASLTGATRDRILRKYEMMTPMERLARGPEIFDRDEDVGVSGISATAGVVPITQGVRTVPPLSVPNMDRPSHAGAGSRDGAGRVAASGAPSQGFVANRLPVTTASLTFNGITLQGQNTRFPTPAASTPSGTGTPLVESLYHHTLHVGDLAQVSRELNPLARAQAESRRVAQMVGISTSTRR